jgi:Na+-driven multidrug efflux pump
MWMTLCCSLPLRLSLCWLFAIELNMGLSGAWLGCGFDWMLQALWVTLLRRTCHRSTETTCGFPRR